jgi:hypothetical protein
MKVLSKKEDGSFSFVHEGVEILHPAMASRGQVSPAEYGFTEYGTGGGCSAWYQEFVLEDGCPVYMLVTQDMSHELDCNEPVELGVYLLDVPDEVSVLAVWTINQDYEVSHDF